MIVLQPTHRLGAMLQVLQQDERLCKVQLHVGDATAAVHGCVLASQCSAAIAGRVYHVLHDHTRPAQLYLSHPDDKTAPCTADTLRRVIGFLYGQPLEVHERAVNEVLQLSLLLGLSDISERIAKGADGPRQDIKGDLCEFETYVGHCKPDEVAPIQLEFAPIGPSDSLNNELDSSIIGTFQKPNSASLATVEKYVCKDKSESIFSPATIEQLSSTWPDNEVSECFTILPTSDSSSKTCTIDVPSDKILNVDRKDVGIPSAYTIDRGLNISCQISNSPSVDSAVNADDSFDVQTVLESSNNNEMTAEMCTLHNTNHVTCSDEMDCLIELTIKEDGKDSCPNLIRTHNYITDTSYLCLQEEFANNSDHLYPTKARFPSKNSSKKRPSEQRSLSPSTSKRRKQFILPNISYDTTVLGTVPTPLTQYGLSSFVSTAAESNTTAAETSALYTTKDATGDKVCLGVGGEAASSPAMSGAGLRCGVCHSYYRRCSDLVKHVLDQQHHSRTCPICAFQSSDAVSQRRHFSLHDSPLPFLCGGCDLRFRTRAHLAMHVPKHSSKRPFSCTECGRTFKWRHALQAHQLRHRAEGHLLCDVCGFSSSYISTFKAHLQQHTGQAFQCPHAGCSFKAFRKNNLKSHLVTHSNLRPHQCDVCGNSFSLARNLSRHMKLHLPARLLCSATSGTVCAFTTTRPDKLRSHLHHKHGIRPDGATEGPENSAVDLEETRVQASSSLEAIRNMVYDRKRKSKRTDAVAPIKFNNVMVYPENTASSGCGNSAAASSEIVHLVNAEEYNRVNDSASVVSEVANCSSEMNTQKPAVKRKRKAILNPLKEPMKIVSDLDSSLKEDTMSLKLKFRKKEIKIHAALKHSNSIPVNSRSYNEASSSTRKSSNVGHHQRRIGSGPVKTKTASPYKTRTAPGSPCSASEPVLLVQQSTSEPPSLQPRVSFILTSSCNAGTSVLNTNSASARNLSDIEVSRLTGARFDASTLLPPQFSTESPPVSVPDDVHFTNYIKSLSEGPAESFEEPAESFEPHNSSSCAVSQSTCAALSSDISQRNRLYAVSDTNSVTSILVSIAYNNSYGSKVVNENGSLETNGKCSDSYVDNLKKTNAMPTHDPSSECKAFHNKIDSSQGHTALEPTSELSQQHTPQEPTPGQSQLHTPEGPTPEPCLSLTNPAPMSDPSQFHTPHGSTPATPQASCSAVDHDASYRLFGPVPDDGEDNIGGSGKLLGPKTTSSPFQLVISDQNSCVEHCFAPHGRITPGTDSAASDGLFEGVMQPEGSEELQFLHLQDCEVSLLPHQSKETISFVGPVLDCIEQRNNQEASNTHDIALVHDGQTENNVRVLSSSKHTADDIDSLDDTERKQYSTSVEQSRTDKSGVERTMFPVDQCENLCQSEVVLECLETPSVRDSSTETVKNENTDRPLEDQDDIPEVSAETSAGIKAVPEDGRCLALDATSFDSLVQSLADLD